MIATARMLMPQSYVRLSAGRLSLSDEAQALCFLAGANSVFLGDRLLTTPNPTTDIDRSLFARLGLRLQVRSDGMADADRRPSTVAALGS
jgi:biotin synthase